MDKKRYNRTPRLTPHARLVLRRRYLKKDDFNRVFETPKQMFIRVAEAIAGADAKYGASGEQVADIADRFYDAMASLDFLPNSPALMNAGRDLGQLSACFVLPVEDSIESIFNAVRDTALIHKSGGGTGFSFSSIRPANDVVKSTRGVSSGPVSFMNVFDIATETIKQGGVRRGANMGLLSVHHPDILEFISVKAENPDKFTNFNLSVAASDEFMNAVKENAWYNLVNPVESGETGGRKSALPARDVFDRIVYAAWRCGDPGLVFIDRINEMNPLPLLGRIEATNPCGEQPLLPYESCTLGSINLSRFIRNKKVDYDRLEDVVRLGVHFLDNVIDVNVYPLGKIEEMTKRNRKIGLGVMGTADMLIGMGVRYGSDEALALCGKIMSFIQAAARDESQRLAERRGNFPSFKNSVYDENGQKYMRNATVTTIAPTGSISIIAGCSSGIEPLYALAYRRRVLDGDVLVEVHPMFRRSAMKRGFWSDGLMRELTERGCAGGVKGVPEDMANLFVTAYEIEPLMHVKMQAAFQKHTDNAVSKTVNLPKDAREDDVRSVFIAAYDAGLKGATIYRDGSKFRQVLSFGDIAKAVSRRYRNQAGVGRCPECGAEMSQDQGCVLCRECGYSQCL